MAAVSRSSSSGLAKASRRPETNRQGSRARRSARCAGVRAARRVEGIADQDQRGHAQAVGRGEGAHAAAEGAAADRDPLGRDREPLRQALGGGADRLNADGGSVGPSLPGGLPRERAALDGPTGVGDHFVDGDEPRLLAARCSCPA